MDGGKGRMIFFPSAEQHFFMSRMSELTKKGHQGIGQRDFLHENLSVLTDLSKLT
jgi:hypothetical protein